MDDQRDLLDALSEKLPEDLFNQDFTDDERERGNQRLERLLDEILGPVEPFMIHSLIPFCVGGALDLHYYARSRFGGTFFASWELTAPEFLPSNRSFDAFELAIATRLTVKPQPGETPAETKKPGFFKRLFSVKSPEEKKRDDLHRVLTNLAFYGPCPAPTKDIYEEIYYFSPYTLHISNRLRHFRWKRRRTELGLPFSSGDHYPGGHRSYPAPQPLRSCGFWL